MIDEAVGGAVVAPHHSRSFELWKQSLGELFAEFYPHLVERVDPPDDPLGEDLMLVERDQRAQRPGCELAVEQRVCGPVALEGLGRREEFESGAGHPLGLDFCARLLGCATPHQRLRLGEEVGQKSLVVISERVVAHRRCQEIAGDPLGPLVDQLIEGVLAVGTRLAPDDRTGRGAHRRAVAGGLLAVRLHIALLEVAGEVRKVVIIGQDGVRLGSQEVVVPDT